MALVVYNPPVLKEFYVAERTFNFTGLQSITISQDWNNDGVAAVVWEAAVILATYLLNMSSDIEGKCILELGAGTGLTGIVASMLKANVTLTDKSDSLKPLHVNTKKNLNSSKHAFKVTGLNWGKGLRTTWFGVWYDYIIGADLVYVESALPDLVTTFEHFMDINKNLIILLSGKVRYQHKYKRFKSLLERTFVVDETFVNEDYMYILKIISKY